MWTDSLQFMARARGDIRTNGGSFVSDTSQLTNLTRPALPLWLHTIPTSIMPWAWMGSLKGVTCPKQSMLYPDAGAFRLVSLGFEALRVHRLGHGWLRSSSDVVWRHTNAR